jgi:predicted AlkP superfamily phosphohydrolase/phosphomutase
MFLAYIDPGSGFTIFTLGSSFVVYLFGFLGLFSLFAKKIFRFLKKHKNIVLIILLTSLALSLIAIGTLMCRQRSIFDKKVIILGFDGLSPEILERMMRKGELANFARLKREGSYKHLSSTNPSQSPVAWSVFATGKNPGKNGVFDFIVRDPQTYKLNLSLSNVERQRPKRVIKSKCFWQYTSEKRVPTSIIACPITFPPDKIYGKMISGMGVPDILGTEGTFTFYTTERISKDKDIGGNVVHLPKAPVMTLYLIGPRLVRGEGVANVKVPFEVSLQKDCVLITHRNKRFRLKVGQWSDWQEVSFKIGLFKKAKGIFKLYLVESQPEFKLYISPINFDPRRPFMPISYPQHYSRELASDIGLYYTQGMPMDTWAVNEKRLKEEAFLEQLNQVLAEKKKILDLELKRLQNGVLFCYFGSPDIIQHMFWRYIDSRHPLYETKAPAEYRKMIDDWYKKMDRILEEVMQKLNPEDTLIVLSDHGFATFRRTVHINSWLRKNGYLELKNPDAETGAELLNDIDWSRTRAYAIGFGAIYINQQGRERDGIVKPGREAELLKAEISHKLKNWYDQGYKQPVINKVYPKEEIFWGEYVNNTPDLYLGMNIGYRASWQTALGAVPNPLIENNLKKWSGSHLFDPQLIPGVIFCNKQITKENASIYDITPTILKIIGYNEQELRACNFDGECLF